MDQVRYRAALKMGRYKMLNRFTVSELNQEIISAKSSSGKSNSKDGKDGKEGKDDISSLIDQAMWS